MLSNVVRRYFDGKIIAMYIGGKSEENIIEMKVTDSRVYSNERIPNMPIVFRHYVYFQVVSSKNLHFVIIVNPQTTKYELYIGPTNSVPAYR